MPKSLKDWTTILGWVLLVLSVIAVIANMAFIVVQYGQNGGIQCGGKNNTMHTSSGDTITNSNNCRGLIVVGQCIINIFFAIISIIACCMLLVGIYKDKKKKILVFMILFVIVLIYSIVKFVIEITREYYYLIGNMCLTGIVAGSLVVVFSYYRTMNAVQ